MKINTHTCFSRITYQFFVVGSLLSFVAIVGTLLTITHNTKPVSADFASPAFPCDGSFFQVRTPGTTANTSLYKLVLDQTGGYTETEVGPLSQNFTGFNAMGYNPLDGYLYGFASTANGGTSFHLYRIDDSGTVTDMGLVGGLSSGGGQGTMAGATFAGNGMMYIVQPVGGSPIRLTTINPTTMTSTYITLSEPIPQGDIAFDPTNGILYAVQANGNGPVRTINTTTGAVTQISSNTSRTNGSAFFDAAGNLYAAGNSNGAVYSVNKTTGVFTQIATGTAASTTDGASCAYSSVELDAIKSLSSVTQLSLTSFRASFSVGVKNTATDTAQNVQMVDRLTSTFSSGNPTITMQSGPTLTSGTCTINPSFNGTSNIKLLSGTNEMAGGSECRVSFTVDITYPSIASIPTSPQNNSALASSSTNTTNNGHIYVDDGLGGFIPVAPPNLLAADTSTNSSSFPSTPNADAHSVTPVTMPTSPIVDAYKSVKLTDNNSNGTINPGDRLTYTITYRNNGNGGATNFQITDMIPSGTTYVASSLVVTPSGVGQTGTANGSFNGGANSNLLSVPVTLQAEGSLVISFAVTINNGQFGALSNQASGDGDNTIPIVTDAVDNSPTGNCAAPAGVSVPASSIAQTCTVAATDQTTATSVPNDATLTITKTDGTTTVNPNGSLTYTITATNPTANSTLSDLAIADTLPANTTFVSASGGGTESSGVVTWNIASLAGGANVTRTVTVTVNAGVANGTVLTNSAVGSSSSDSGLCARSGSSCTGTDTTTVDNPPVVTLTKTDGAGTVNPGGSLTYTLTLTNTAVGSTASNLTISDTLPTGTTFVSASGGGTHAAGVVTWNIASLAGGANLTRTVTVTANQNVADGTILTNSASVSSSSDSGLCARSGSSCTGTDTTTFVNQPVLTVTKDDGASTAHPGDTLTYTVTINNTAANSVALNINLQDTLPAHTTFVSASGGGSHSAGVVSWNIASLAGSASTTRTVTVTVNAGTADTTVLTNSVTASIAGNPSVCSRPGASCTGTDTTTVDNPPIITMTKTDGAASAIVGSTLTYTLTLTNTAVGSTAENVVAIADTISSYTTFVSASDGGTESGGIVSWTIPSLPGGTSVTRTVTVTVNGGTLDGTILTNTASASITGDPTACSRPGASCTGTDNTTIDNFPKLDISKTDGVSSAHPGDTLTYAVAINNPAIGSTTNDIVVVDTLPSNVTFVSADGGGTESGGVVTWDLASLVGGNTVTRHVTVTVNAATPNGTVLTNQAVGSSTGDPALCARAGSNCTGTDNTTVDNPPVITVTKSDGASTVNPGGSLTYTITVNNSALGSTATNLIIDDTLPTDVTFQSANGGGSFSAGVVSWTIPTLAGGSSTTRTVTVQVNAGITDGATLTNTAVASIASDSGLCARAGSDCSGSDSTTIDNPAVVTLAKDDGATATAPGQNLTYTITVSNTAVGSTAQNLVVSDTLPTNVTFVSASDGGTHSAGVVTWNIASLAGGSSTTRTVTVTVNAGTSDGTTLTNNAAMSSSTDSGLCARVGANCTASDTTTVSTLAAATLTKDDGATTINHGDTLTYTLTVENPIVGSTATNLVITDTLPTNVTFVSASGGGTESSGVVTWNIASLAGGTSTTRTVTVTVNNSVNDGDIITNNASLNSSSDSGLCSRPGSNCSAVDNTTVDIPANPFDPPSGYKTFDATGLPKLTWKMVWINAANSGPELVRIVDPLQTDTPYIANSLLCQAQGSSVTTRCEYDTASNSIIWEGTLGSDAGATDETSAANEVVITVDVNVPDSVNSVLNQGQAFWDQDGNGILDNSDSNIANNQPALTGNVTDILSGQNQATVYSRAASLANTGQNIYQLITLTITLLCLAIIALFSNRFAQSRRS